MRKFLVVGYCLLQPLFIKAQGQLDTLPKALTRHEYTIGGIVYTNGWGLEYAYGEMKNAKLKTVYSVDIAVVHDPKEIKITNPSVDGNERFVYGKTNFLLNLRFAYGKIRRLYEKKDVGGIEIRYFYKIGPVFAFQKPIYYRIKSDKDTTESIEKFTNAAHQLAGSIKGKASFFKGVNELNVIPGIHAKAGFSFEFGKQDLIINAIEGGVSLDVFAKKIELMANNQNQFLYSSLFMVFRFGKINNSRIKKSYKKQQGNE